MKMQGYPARSHARSQHHAALTAPTSAASRPCIRASARLTAAPPTSDAWPSRCSSTGRVSRRRARRPPGTRARNCRAPERSARTPAACSATRCRSSDWEPSAVETRAEPIRMYRKRPFAIHRRKRLQAGAAACRIPCLILCVADVARTSCPSNARLQSKEYDRRRTRTPAHHGGPGARRPVRGGTQVAFGIAAENTGAQDRDQGRAGGLRSQALASAARGEGR